MIISREEATAFARVSADFAKEKIATLCESSSGQIDNSALKLLLDEAENLGMLASHKSSSAGYETGIWGQHIADNGPGISLLLLEKIAQQNAGVAMIFHITGLAGYLLRSTNSCDSFPSNSPAIALCENGFTHSTLSINNPTKDTRFINSEAIHSDNNITLNGKKDFVWQSPLTDSYIAFVQSSNRIESYIIPLSAEGLSAEDAGRRTGLHECGLYHITMNNIKISKDNLLNYNKPAHQIIAGYLTLWRLGIAAICTGVAAKAYDMAKQYAAERYQGGTQIINHPAIRTLLADSSARISMLSHCTDINIYSSAKIKLMCSQNAAQTVSDCLQVFGGYGYMEDMKIEKLYRDINTLKHVGGSAREMRAIIAEEMVI